MARIVLATGSRDHSVPALARDRIRRDLDRLCPELVIVGDARGTDTWVVEWCHENAVQVEIYRPLKTDIALYGKRAWPMRNTRMVNVAATYVTPNNDVVVLAQPDQLAPMSAGTMDTIIKSVEANLDILISH